MAVVNLQTSVKMSVNKPDDIIEMHIKVLGNVQGVGFRYTTSEYARQMKILGTVRNLPDGSVEIYAAGRRNAINGLLAALQQAFGSYISKMVVEEVSPVHTYSDFSIVK